MVEQYQGIGTVRVVVFLIPGVINALFVEPKIPNMTEIDLNKNMIKTTHTLSNGDNSISGQIYCTEEAEYTFIFAFEGTNGCHYEAGIGTNVRIYPNNGGSFRTITTVLKPGAHDCFVDVKFTGSDQQGYGRLVITKINNVPLNMAYEGSVDLVASGHSNRTPDIGTIPGHWRCSTCGLLNSWIPKCAACGAENKEYKN